jgi:hypothetical protein
MANHDVRINIDWNNIYLSFKNIFHSFQLWICLRLEGMTLHHFAGLCPLSVHGNIHVHDTHGNDTNAPLDDNNNSPEYLRLALDTIRRKKGALRR